ncbi:MAG: D-hexose-6-phosphate mutarotase [Lentisphaeria bacterium]|nr:D-hexose-6-phosphate mutarotase [Lentisphaeria bacterium]NQZ69658.1 D-hexose-6-phosphate mutarotase [Lentisphaeria bacterium]
MSDSLEAANYCSLINSADHYKHEGAGLDLLLIKSPACQAVIALQGAHVMEFQAMDKEPILWLSPKAVFEEGRAIRGGIPICAPWFNQHPDDDTKPKHGFLRHSLWSLKSYTETDEQQEIVLEYNTTKDDLKLYPHDFTARLTLRLSSKLELILEFENRSAEPMPLTWAFHSYFAVTDVNKCSVEGLEGSLYIDTRNGRAVPSYQKSTFVIDAEVDRVYESIGSSQIIRDKKHTIQIRARRAPSVVVWNPGPIHAEKMSDVGAGNHQGFVCLERGSIWKDATSVEAGSTLKASLHLSN